MFKRYDPDSRPPADHPVPILTMGVISICILVFLAINFQGGTDEVIQRWGYVDAEEIWKGGYRGLISSVFVHKEALHLIFNLYALWIIGAVVETEIGPGRWLAFFLGSAVVSSGAQMLTGETGIGMSGVNYALFGFAWASRWQFDAFRQVISPQTAVWYLVWLVGCWVSTLAGAMNVANEAHLGGLLFGTLVGEVLVRKRHRVLLSLAFAALVAVSLVPVFWAPWTGAWARKEAAAALERQDFKTAEPWLLQSLRDRETNPEWVWMALAGVYASRSDGAGIERARQELEKLESAEEPATEPK